MTVSWSTTQSVVLNFCRLKLFSDPYDFDTMRLDCIWVFYPWMFSVLCIWIFCITSRRFPVELVFKEDFFSRELKFVDSKTVYFTMYLKSNFKWLIHTLFVWFSWQWKFMKIKSLETWWQSIPFLETFVRVTLSLKHNVMCSKRV